jgi:hypothetical protein
MSWMMWETGSTTAFCGRVRRQGEVSVPATGNTSRSPFKRGRPRCGARASGGNTGGRARRGRRSGLDGCRPRSHLLAAAPSCPRWRNGCRRPTMRRRGRGAAHERLRSHVLHPHKPLLFTPMFAIGGLLETEPLPDFPQLRGSCPRLCCSGRISPPAQARRARRCHWLWLLHHACAPQRLIVRAELVDTFEAIHMTERCPVDDTELVLQIDLSIQFDTCVLLLDKDMVKMWL